MRWIRPAVGLAACVTAALLVPQAKAEDVPSFVARFVRDFENLDWPRFRVLFSDDSTVFFPPQYGAPLASGRAETDPAWERVFAALHAASRAQAPPYMKLNPREVAIQQWPGGAVVTFLLGGGEAPLNRRTLVLREKGDGFEIIHLHGSTIAKPN